MLSPNPDAVRRHVQGGVWPGGSESGTCFLLSSISHTAPFKQ